MQRPRRRCPRRRARSRARATLAATWRPPGLAWAATFVLTIGLGALLATTYRWSQPLYATYTAATPATPDVLHIAFERSLPVGEVEEAVAFGRRARGGGAGIERDLRRRAGESRRARAASAAR